MTTTVHLGSDYPFVLAGEAEDVAPHSKNPVLHVAGEPAVAGAVVRQRCTWCGQLLLEHSVSDVPPGHNAATHPGPDCEGCRAAALSGQAPLRSFPVGRPVLRARDGSVALPVGEDDVEALRAYSCSHER